MTRAANSGRSDRRTSWLSGLLLGALGGFLLLEFPLFGLLLVVVSGILVSIAGQRSAGLGGLLAGVGGMWLLVLGRVKLTCSAEGGCEAPTIDGYLVVAFVILAVGVAVTIAAARPQGD